jgi:hypothetical protein
MSLKIKKGRNFIDKLKSQMEMRKEVSERYGIDSCEVCGSPKIYLWIGSFGRDAGNNVIRCGNCGSTLEVPNDSGDYTEPESFKCPKEECMKCRYATTCKSSRKSIGEARVA